MHLEELEILVAIAETGSQAGASRQLGVSRATLRRRLAQLEGRINVPLVRIGPRGAELSEAARVAAGHARRVLDEVSRLFGAVRELAGSIDAAVRIAIPIGAPSYMTAPMLGYARMIHPDLRVHLLECADPIAALDRDVDLAIHFGTDLPPGAWESFPVLDISERAIASPSYLAERGTPTCLEDLARHALLSWQGPGVNPLQWPTRSLAVVPVRPALISADIHLLRMCAHDGMGIAFLPDGMLTAPPGEEGEFVHVLPDILFRERPISIVARESMLDIPRIQVVLAMVRDIASAPAISGILPPTAS